MGDLVVVERNLNSVCRATNGNYSLCCVALKMERPATSPSPHRLAPATAPTGPAVTKPIPTDVLKPVAMPIFSDVSALAPRLEAMISAPS